MVTKHVAFFATLNPLMSANAQTTPQITSRIIGIPAGVDAATQIPVTVIHGARPGPTLALVAGNHGYEYAPILALQRLRTQIDPAQLSGTVMMVHVANMPSFLGRTVYFSPVDGQNLNRVYPGREDGTVSQRIAYAVTKEVIEQCDYLLDLHGGDGNESLRPYIYETVTPDPEMNKRIGALALSLGFDHIVMDHGRPTDPAKSLYCSTTAITRGKPAVTVESGCLGMSDEASVQKLVDAVHGAMRHAQMYEGPGPAAFEAIYLDPTEVLNSPATGILYPDVEPDQHVNKGDRLAHITDFFGTELAEVRAPFDGVVLYIVATPPITKGQPVGMIGSPRKGSR